MEQKEKPRLEKFRATLNKQASTRYDPLIWSWVLGAGRLAGLCAFGEPEETAEKSGWAASLTGIV